jgi:hypothetical protein
MPRFLSNLRSLSISTSTSPLRSSLPRSRAAYSISKPLLASDAPPPSSNPPVEDATNPELPIEGNEYEVAEIVDETVPEYKWPDRMPQQVRLFGLPFLSLLPVLSFFSLLSLNAACSIGLPNPSSNRHSRQADS